MDEYSNVVNRFTVNNALPIILNQAYFWLAENGHTAKSEKIYTTKKCFRNRKTFNNMSLSGIRGKDILKTGGALLTFMKKEERQSL